MMRSSTERGKWVFFQNCHLAPSWMPTLERLIEHINPDKVHFTPSVCRRSSGATPAGPQPRPGPGDCWVCPRVTGTGGDRLAQATWQASHPCACPVIHITLPGLFLGWGQAEASHQAPIPLQRGGKLVLGWTLDIRADTHRVPGPPGAPRLPPMAHQPAQQQVPSVHPAEWLQDDH